MRIQYIFIWALKIITVSILLLGMRLKFIAHPESVFIFTKLHLEPWGRIGAGITELIASVFILIPRTTAWGALIALTVMTGAIFFHLTSFDVAVRSDNGLFFYMAITAWICSAILFIKYRGQVLIRLQKMID
jgi:uncharacterized membrane protein YphA (DoxX/SURF4 family)